MDSAANSRVIVAAGASLADLEALRYAVAQARARGAALHVVSSWRVTPAWQGAGLQQWREALADEAAAVVRDNFDRAMAGVPADLEVQVSVVEGARGPALVDYADRDQDLLVVGGPAGPRRWRWAASAVARYCAGHAGCVVAVVPAPALARAGRLGSLARALRRETVEHVERCGGTPVQGRPAAEGDRGATKPPRRFTDGSRS